MLLVLAVVLAGLFVVVDRAAPNPLLPGRLLTQPDVRAGAVASFVNTATTSSAITLLTLYLQDHLGRSPLATAATLVPFSLFVVAASGLAARLLARLGPNAVMGLGLLAIAAADAVLCVTVDLPVGPAVCAAVAGAGIGLSSVAATRRGRRWGPPTAAARPGWSTPRRSSGRRWASPSSCSSPRPPTARPAPGWRRRRRPG